MVQRAFLNGSTTIAFAHRGGGGDVCVADGRVQRPLFSALSGAGTWVR
jgi:hypothetical protein